MTPSKKLAADGGPRIAIIGGGFGGIAMGVYLLKSGFRNFTIFEKDAGPGGTWWANDYPGAEVDLHSAIYSFSFASRNFTRTHAGQAELLNYIKDVVRDFGLTPHFRYNTRVTDVEWDDVAHHYSVKTADGEQTEFPVVISAVGMLSDPKHPDWPGLDDYRGVLFHTAEWDHSVDLSGKRVAVVGVGSTATQVVPAIADKVERLYVIQREPGWVLPKNARDFTDKELRRYENPLMRRIRRYLTYGQSEMGFIMNPVFVADSKGNRKARKIALDYIDQVFAGRPDLKEAVTPRYTFSAKRRVVSDDYYPALLKDNVAMVTGGVAGFTPTGLVTGTGRHVDVDVIIAATGFKATQYLSTLNVTGRGGRTLREEWQDGPYAYLGIMVPRFPNLFIMYGPNTNGAGPITGMLERQARFICAQLRRLVSSGHTAVEVKEDVTRKYNHWLQGRLAETAWKDGNNYFKTADGKIVTQWRDGMLRYIWVTTWNRRRAVFSRRASAAANAAALTVDAHRDANVSA